MIIPVHAIVDTGIAAINQQRAVDIYGIIVRCASPTVIPKLLAAREVSQLYSKQLCADSRRTVDPQPVVSQQLGS